MRVCFVELKVGPRNITRTRTSGIEVHSSTIAELETEIEKLQQENQTLLRDVAKYRTFWIGECRLKELLDAGHDKEGAISQPRWDASSEGSEYGMSRLRELEEIEGDANDEK